MTQNHLSPIWLLSLALVGLPQLSFADDVMRPSLNQFGRAGLIDTPTASSLPDAELSFSLALVDGSQRNAVTFQIGPRISGTFRYANIKFWDRSFDISYRLVDEGRLRPAVSIGLRDFMGTGIYSSQYIVATKQVNPNITASLGAGWGRLSGSTEIEDIDFGRGGTPNFSNLFRGEVGVFGGIEWQTPIEGLRLKAEYSPDRYVYEGLDNGDYTPLNFGISYVTRRNAQFDAYYIHGTTVGASVSFSLNPTRDRTFLNPRPDARLLAIAPRAVPESQQLTLVAGDSQPNANTTRGYTQQLQDLVGEDSIRIISSDYSANRVEIRIRNNVFIQPEQAVERTMRAMSQVMPAYIDTFDVVLLEANLPISSVSMSRDNLEEIGADTTNQTSFANAISVISAEPPSSTSVATDGVFPQFVSYITPVVSPHLFDPDAPLRADLRAQLYNGLVLGNGLSFTSIASFKLVGNLDENVRGSNSVLERVRTDLDLYQQNSDVTIDQLTVDYLVKISPDLYGRVSAGIFEQMYGGVSTEVLWAPQGSPLSLGAEVNWVQQRAYDQQFGFRDYSTVTGHVSAYYEMNNNYFAQADVGRYLAGDIGTTLSLERRFDNGWAVGAFATFTDVSFDDFGEGSFDKGFTITVPFGWFTGQDTRRRHEMIIRPVTRDGGARVSMPNRLYDIVSTVDSDRVFNNW
jgi:hypothetical protein